MNSCILMAQIVSDPELRSTQDNREISSMMVEFEGLRTEESPARIKVVGWGNLASEIKNNYTQGDRVIIEGRLSMNLIEMPEGYKEKRAELIASRIYLLNRSNEYAVSATTTVTKQESPPAAASSSEPIRPKSEPMKTPSDRTSKTDTTTIPTNTSDSSTNSDWDDIPFRRSLSLKTSEIDRQDFWEVAANRPGMWLHGSRDLFGTVMES
ncbi:single-stranded DNA-binding protein [Pleurocapsales cyanobacterium LEGE 06147]|nr:single-stranded DNA-binding protein [Pleurocapsales cyanobacterium LEGE 06147]